MIARATIHAAHCHCEACSDDPTLRARKARVRAATERPALSDALTRLTLAALGVAVFLSTFVSR